MSTCPRSYEYLPQGTLFPELDSKWTSLDFKKIEMLQDKDYRVSGHEQFFHRLTHYKYIVQMYYLPNIYSP